MSNIATNWLIGGASAALAAAIILALFMRKGASAEARRASLVQIAILLVAIGLLALIVLRAERNGSAAHESPPAWRQTGATITEGISGLALVSSDANGTRLLAVHDNKQPGQKRLSLLQRTPDGDVETKELRWTAEALPIDLEAIARVPADPSTFLALTSKGALHRFTFDATASTLGFDTTPAGVPNASEERQFESFDVQQIGAQTFACWAERGDATSAPGVIFCATFDPAALTFGEPQPLEVRVPWPETHTRHISDLRLLSDGTILIAAATDPDDDGPFAGAIYVAGTLQPAPERPQLIAAQPAVRLLTTPTHKIEALELVPGPAGGMVVGSDDENLGAAVLFTW